MTISCRLRLLMARVNLEQARRNQAGISLRQLASESGVSLSVLTALNTGRNQRIDYATIDRLLGFFNRFFPTTASDLLVWENDQSIGRSRHVETEIPA